MHKPLLCFAMASLLWLVPALGIWYWLQDAFAWPPAHIGAILLHYLYPGWIADAQASGASLTLQTNIADAAGATLTFRGDALLFCYGQPLLAALFLAARTPRIWWKLPAGLLALVPLQTWGLCFFLLLSVACAGPAAYARTGFTQMDLDLFALAYQMGYLLMPALGPVLVWLWLDSAFLARITSGDSPREEAAPTQP